MGSTMEKTASNKLPGVKTNLKDWPPRLLLLQRGPNLIRKGSRTIYGLAGD